jgi:hypothetical protein
MGWTQAFGNRVVRNLGLAVVVFGLVSAGPLLAQTPKREGFWLGAGLGYGSLALGCDGCSGLSREGALSGYLKLGGTVNPSLRLGGETNGWVKSESGVTFSTGLAAGTVTVYPAPANGLFLKGGAGVSYAKVDVSGSGSDSETGWGGIAGIGYDIPVGRTLYLTPVANWVYGHYSDWHTTNVQLALGITWH